MARLKSSKSKSLVGLDIEAGSIAATEVVVNGSVDVVGGGIVELPPGVFREGEVVDAGALGEALRQLFAESKLSKTVRLGIANQRVAVRTMRLPDIADEGELETAIRFQAQEHIPMPLDQAVLDWQVVGHTHEEGADPRLEVVAVAARRDMLAQMMQALSAAGLRPAGIDHAAFGMIRALERGTGSPVGAGEFVSAPGSEEASAPKDPSTGLPHVPAKLLCNLGDVTNLAVARDSSCLFTRISSFGVEGIAQKLAERRQLTLEHARQWLVHTGLERPTEAIEGDREHIQAARDCLADGAARLTDELRLSLDYYGAQEGAIAVEEVVVCGPGSTIPGLVERLQRTLGLAITVSRPAALAGLDDATAARQTLSFGLALEE